MLSEDFPQIMQEAYETTLDKALAFDAIIYCGVKKIAPPMWAIEVLRTALVAIKTFQVGSWDEALGHRPISARKLEKRRRDQLLRMYIYARLVLRDRRSEAISKALFYQIGQECNPKIGATLAEDLYRKERKEHVHFAQLSEDLKRSLAYRYLSIIPGEWLAKDQWIAKDQRIAKDQWTAAHYESLVEWLRSKAVPQK
jgi:hypothetical protein